MPASAWESLGLQDPDSFRVDPPVTPAGPLKDDRTLFAKANDWMIDTGNAAASLAGAGVSLVSPDGGAAKSIADFIKEGEGNQSDYRQKLRAELGQLIEDAKAKGDTGTLAWLQHNLSNPVTELLPQAVGNFGPFAAAGKVAGGLGAARAAAGGATAAEAATAGTSAALGATSTLGGVVGAGGVRQGYYEEIQKATDEQLLKESPEYAKLRETMYEQDAKKTLGGQMNPRLAAGMGIGGTVGVISGRLGAEQALFGKNPGFARTVGAEVGGEFVEGATQQGAQNFAVQGQMPSKPLMDDVLLQGVQEAVIAAPGGIVAGAMHRPKAPEEQVKDIVDAPDLQSAVEATRQVIAGLGVNPPAGSRVIDPALMTAADTQQAAGAMTDDALVTAQSRFEQEAAAAQQMMREQAMNRIQAPTQPAVSSLGPQIDQRRQEAGVANAAEDQVSREAGIDQMRAEQVQGALRAPIPEGTATDLATGQPREPIQGPMQAAFARLQEQRKSNADQGQVRPDVQKNPAILPVLGESNADAGRVGPDVGQAVQPAVQESVAGNSNDAAAVELPGRDTGGSGLRVSSGQSADAVQNTGQIAADRVPAGQSAGAIDTLNSSLANQRKQRGEDSTQPAVTAVDPGSLPTMRKPLKEGGATLSKHEFETVKKFAGLFGKKVELFRHNDPTSSDKFDGAVLDTSDTIYLNADARDAHHLVVVGHEVGHQLKKDAPDLYKQLETRLKSDLNNWNLAKFGEYYGKSNKEVVAQLKSAEGRGAIVEEFLSDLIGNRSAEYRTMLDIFGAAKGSKDAGMIYKVAQFLVDFIDGLIAKINRSKFETDRLVTDLNKVRREVRAALKEYAVRQNVEVGPKVPAEKAPATVAKPVAEPEAKPTPQEAFEERLKAFKEKKVAAKSKPNESKPAVVPTGEAPADTKPVDEVAHEAATSPKNNLPTPTEKQKEAGNYAKGHTRIAGLDISIENPAGSKRRPEWKALKDHYGYFKRSIAFDAPDNVDVFVKPGTPSDFAGKVYVIDQISPKTGKFDEHKVMLGYDSKAEANDAYHRNYQNGWKGMASITAMPQEKFRDWLRSDAPSKGPVDKGAVMRTRAKAFDAQPKMSAPRKMDALKKSASRQTDTPAFKQWFKQSTVVNEDGTPKVMYHGTAQDITEFKPKQAGAIFVTDRPDFAEDFGGYSEGWMSENFTPTRAQEKAAVARAREILIKDGEKPENIAKYSATQIKDEYAYQQALQDLLPSRANIMPLYVSAQNPFDYENKAHVDALTKALSADAKLADKIGRGFWGVIESPPVQKAIKGLGHDGFNVFEGGHKNLAVYESSQLKSAIGNTGKFDPANPDIRKSGQRAPAFYSALAKAVSGINAKSQPAFGWKQQIEALIRKGDVKADEVQWTGLNEFLDLQQGKVSKESVEQFLSENGVRLEETRLASGETIVDGLNEKLAGTGYEAEWAMADDETASFVGPDGEYIDYADLPDEVRKIVDESSNDQPAPSKYGTYVVPGGKNYKELLLTLPVAPRRYSYDAFNPATQKSQQFETRQQAESFANEDATGATVVSEIDTSPRPDYQSAHWDQSNVIAHTRIDERADADGNRVLFVNEIQSDYGQDGKKKGFAVSESRKLSGTPKEVGVDGPFPEWIVEWEDGSFSGGYGEAAARARAAEGKSNAKAGLPPAPFVQKTDAWVGLTLKRLIMHAVEKGFDKVAIINGEQAADLYDLSKRVKSIDYRLNPSDGTYNITVLGLDGQGAIWGSRRATLQQIEDHVGKETAQKIEKNEGRDLGFRDPNFDRSLSGDGLKVGGEGMRTFYDSIVPKVAKSVLKKLGGGQPSEIRIGMTWDEYLRSRGITQENGKLFVNGDSELYMDGVRRQYKEDHPDGQTVQVGFDITPEMRETVLQNGVPLFSRQRARWDVDEPSKMDDFIRTMQDKHVDLKRVTQAIEEQVGKIEDKFNPYQAEELYHGRSAKQTTDFLQGDLKKLLTDMRMRKVSIEDLGKFLHARHAEERNKRMAEINPNDPEMQDGGSGMSTKDAKAYLAGMSPEQKRSYAAIAARVDAINKGTQELLVSSGLEKQSTIDAWNSAYKHYVPLMRDEVADAVGMGTGQGYSVRGSATKRAMGSKKDVIDILANVAMQRERAIVRSEKNRVAQALWGLAAKAENKDIWLAVSPDDDPVKLEADLVRLGMNPIDAAGVAKEPQQRYVDPRTGMVQWRVNPMLRSSPNVVSMRVDGEERYVFMNEKSDRAKAIAASIKNLDADQLGVVLSTSAVISRFFAKINTQYSPIFGIVNAVRDVQAAALNLSSTPLAGKQKVVLSQTMSALKGIYSDLRDTRAGKPASSKWAALFEEFQKEGGQTGYKDMFSSSEDRAKALEKELRKLSEGKAKAAGRAVFDWLTDYNDSMENAVRLATYKVGKENGLTNQQAASVAKGLMNFNRRGAIATQAGALYAFYNASAQGTARIAQTMFDMKGGDYKTIRLNKNGKKILYGGVLLGSMQALLLAAAGLDDDDVPDFIRERSLVIPLGGKKYVTIPMPLGLHVIPNIGRNATEFALSGGKDPGKRIVSMLGTLADAFNPIGNSGVSIQTIAPTAVDPLVALAENRDFTGRPISRPDFSSLNPQPGHTRAKDTASFIGKGMSYALNLVTGGTDYKPGAFSPTPDQIDYLLGQLTGGVGREAMKAQQTLSAGYTGEDLPPHKVPLLGRFYGDAGVPSAQSSKFYQHVTELNGHKSEIDGRIKAGKPVGDYMRENPEFALIPLATSTQRQISDLKKMKKMLADNGNNKAAKMIEDQITMAMRTLNDRYKAIEARQ